MGNLISLNDAKAYLRTTSNDADGMIDKLIAGAESFCERYCAVAFKCETRTEHHSGGMIFLEPFIKPLVSVTSVYDRIAEDTLTEDTDFQVVGNQLLYGYPSNSVNWIKGYKRYQVVLVSGYNDGNAVKPDNSTSAPSAFKSAVLHLVHRMWTAQGGITSLSVEGVSRSLDSLATGEITTILDQLSLKSLV